MDDAISATKTYDGAINSLPKSMARNDAVLIDSLIAQLTEEYATDDIGEVFERFVLEQVLKKYDLTKEQIDAGWIDGSLDGGIDGFYIFVNGALLTDLQDFMWPRSGVELEVVLVTCKHASSFQQGALDAALPTIIEIFDLRKTNNELQGKYSTELLECRKLFSGAYTKLAINNPKLNFKFIYASRGEVEKLGQSIIARGNQIAETFKSLFSACSAEFDAFGAAELVNLFRKVKNFALDLPFHECLTAGQEGYVVLANLIDYSNFVSDEQGSLRRYLFDSNVRAYLGGNVVNSDISRSLANEGSPNFWWLNNGVTILATKAVQNGKVLAMKDIQIVNGLQTTESIHKHFSQKPKFETDSRALLVKVIVSQDETIRDEVIRATNNQTSVEPSALHATEKIQRDIEDVLIRHDWFYERRTNHYKSEGHSESRIIQPFLLAIASTSLMLCNPVASSRFKQKQLRKDEAYELVYSSHFPLEVWPAAAALIRASENAIIRHGGRASGNGNVISSWRGSLAYIAAVRIIKTFKYNHRDLSEITSTQLKDEFMDDTWLQTRVQALNYSPLGRKVNATRFHLVCESLANIWGISEKPLSGVRSLSNHHTQVQRVPLDDQTIESIKSLLPPKPWRKDIVESIAKHLEIASSKVWRVIREIDKHEREKKAAGVPS